MTSLTKTLNWVWGRSRMDGWIAYTQVNKIILDMQQSVWSDLHLHTTQYPFIHLLPPTQLGKPVPDGRGREAGYTPDRSPVCCRANTKRQTTIHSHLWCGHFRITIYLTPLSAHMVTVGGSRVPRKTPHRHKERMQIHPFPDAGIEFRTWRQQC